MLSDAAQTMFQLARKIADDPYASVRGSGINQLLEQFIFQMPCPIETTRLQIASFSAIAQAQITVMLTSNNNDLTSDELVYSIKRIISTASELKRRLYQCASDVANFRDLLAAEIVSALLRRSQYQDALVTRYAQRVEWNERINTIKARISAMNRNPFRLFINIFGAVVIGRSLALNQLMTAIDRSKEISRDCTNIENLIRRTDGCREMTEDLIRQTQGIANLLALIACHLANNEQMSSAINKETALLFLTTLKKNLELLDLVIK